MAYVYVFINEETIPVKSILNSIISFALSHVVSVWCNDPYHVGHIFNSVLA